MYVLDIATAQKTDLFEKKKTLAPIKICTLIG